MADQPDNQQDVATPSMELESGTYEIIRNRLTNCGSELRSRLDQLNAARKDVFGSIDTALLSTERITTEHNCIARDMVAVGHRFLFGYNVHLGLKSETEAADVFAVYSFANHSLSAEDLQLLDDDEFQRDFRDLFRYYRNAVFAKFAVRGPHLYMVFRVGKSVTEVKVFKWLIDSSDPQNTVLRYINNRSDHEYRFPPQHDFEWIRATRDDHHYGDHPHISILDRVFVETVGGDLTVKIENNTDTGEGIYAEPVDDPDQTLDDAEVSYAAVGHIILLKIRPYQEQQYRFLVFNEKLQQVMRLDSIRDACILLPDDHGLIFPGGFYLQDGEYKTFDHGLSDMLFERTIAAPNGEDYLFVFYNRDSGTYVLLQYNLIEQKVRTPLICNGWTFFDAGELLCFKSQGDAQKHHAIQLWQTPYVGEDYVPQTHNDSFLSKIGNKEIVRAMAECHEILNLIDKDDSYANLYTDLVRQSSDTADSYFWLGRDDTFNLAETLSDIKAAATSAVEAFDRVIRVRQETASATQTTGRRTNEILSQVRHRHFEHISEFVTSLSDLRAVRGDIISLKELRYADEQLIEQLETDVAEHTDRLSRRCVEFLLRPASLEPYAQTVHDQQSQIEHLTKVTDARSLEEDIASSAADLEMLIEIVSNLQIDDATQRTAIVDHISSIFATVNQARALLKKKRKELASVEGVAEFNSQMKLLNQAVVNYLDICDQPERCDEFLTSMLVQLEELEGRFAEFDEFILQLTEKREEICNAFESRRLQLVEARNKRATALLAAADRVLKGIQSRVQSLESISDINGYFAADLMIEKVRSIADQLLELDDTVKVDDIQSRLKTIREDAVRQLKDRQELYIEGEHTIRLGAHLFSVNTQVLDLTTVIRDEDLCLHLTGTGFFEPVRDDRLTETRHVRDQQVVSENNRVYRAEYLAWKILNTAQSTPHEVLLPVGEKVAEGRMRGQVSQAVVPGDSTPAHHSVAELVKLSDEERLTFVQRFMGPRYEESYTRGVHDVDAARIVKQLAEMHQNAGLLRFDARSRALASLCWNHLTDRKTRNAVGARMAGAGAIAAAFSQLAGRASYVTELHTLLQDCISQFPALTSDHDPLARVTARRLQSAAEYLFCELSDDSSFGVSATAMTLSQEFRQHVKSHGFAEAFEKSVAAVHKDTVSCFVLLRNWIQAFLALRSDPTPFDYVDEVALILMSPPKNTRSVLDAALDATLKDMIGSHPVIESGSYRLRYHHFVERLAEFDTTTVPAFNTWKAVRHDIVEQGRDDLRLDEFRPRVLTSFVRNRLLNDVYLPIIGDNLAKQIGSAGEEKRTDLMGLLLLVSPPGYGKTTLMEYIANRLGLIFMKINGPALGHAVTSLDPAEATNAGAREEVEKLNLALEMGDNVMIYLDDIQHTHPEFLQKFISLCDAQRRIEGVWKGRSRTYDLRGRKVAVVMAGNPYTESGEKFQIPDMLANRADIYNLGEIIGESADAFEMSYLENALTSSPALSRLSSGSQQDVYSMIRMAADEARDGIELEGNYSLDEINEFVSTMRRLMQVRDVILSVNREYIRSAAQNDDYRTEPPFKLQGSYRNMNRIAEKVVPIMNDRELTSLIVSSYENDAQTLTSGTEANLLKFKELAGLLTEDESARWNDIKRTFRQNVKLRGISDDDRTGQVIATLGNLSDGLNDIQKALSGGVTAITAARDDQSRELAHRQDAARLQADLQSLRTGLDTINQSLSEGLSQLTASRTPQHQSPTESADSASTPSVAVVEPDSESSARTTINPDTGRITVVNRIPPTMVSILKQQFRLMNRWLEPIHQASQTQQSDMTALREQLSHCLELYEKLIERIEADPEQHSPPE